MLSKRHGIVRWQRRLTQGGVGLVSALALGAGLIAIGWSGNAEASAPTTVGDQALCTSWPVLFRCSPRGPSGYFATVVKDPDAPDRFGVCLSNEKEASPWGVYRAQGYVAVGGVSWLQLVNDHTLAGHLVTQKAGSWVGNVQFSGQREIHPLTCQP